MSPKWVNCEMRWIPLPEFAQRHDHGKRVVYVVLHFPIPFVKVEKFGMRDA
jgi:hypothetical protein